MTREQINDYVESKTGWATSTKNTVRAKLNTLSDIGFEPSRCFTYLDSRGYSRYSIKTYFILASELELQFAQYLKDNASLFRNAYQEKTESISHNNVIRLLVEATEISSHAYNLIYLMAFCGLRLSEAQAVRLKDIKDNVLEVVGKGRKYRTVPINTSRLSLAPLTSPEALVAGAVNPRPLLSRYNITPHSLRAFYITHVVRSKILDLDQARQVAGHASILTTQRYLRTDMNDIKKRILEAGL